MNSRLPENAPQSLLIPVQLTLDDKFQFRCRKGIACFNKCCENIDILLTPYDIVRLKNRLGITSREFIDAYTTDFAMDGQGTPGPKTPTKAGPGGLLKSPAGGRGRV